MILGKIPKKHSFFMNFALIYENKGTFRPPKRARIFGKIAYFDCNKHKVYYFY